MSHRSFAETVLSAQPLSLDSVLYTPTLLDSLVSLFRFPLGRDYPGKHWGGPRAKRDRRLFRMQRMREADGFHFFSSDDREYHEPVREEQSVNDEGHQEVKVIPLGWRRLTPKVARPGRERRVRLRAERVTA